VKAMNIKVQCCGIALMLVILYFYGRQRKISLNTEKAFMRMFWTIMFSLILDILSLVALTNMNQLPVLLVDIVCKTYLATLVLVALCGVLYVCTDIYIENEKYRKVTFAYHLLACIGILCIYILPIEKICNDENEMYTAGPSAMATYVLAFFFFAATLFLMKKHKDKMNPRRKEAVEIWVCIWFIAAITQFVFKELLLVGYAGAIAVMVIYLKLENPETNLDRQTGLYNQNTFLQYIMQLYGKGQKFALLSILFPSSQIINMEAEDDIKVRMEIIRFLQDIPEALVFKNAEDEMLLLFKDEEQAVKCEDMLKHRFQLGWGLDGSVFVTPSWRLIPDGGIVNKAIDILYLLRYTRINSEDFSDNDTLIIDEKIVQKMYGEKKTEQLILDAIEKDRIEVYYQPIYSVEEKCFTCAEALVRIRDEKDQLVPPGVFVEVAERNGMIIRLGEIVFEKVCKFLQKNQPRQLGLQYIEVNLSAVQCTYEYLADTFIRIMKKYQIDSSWINLEITESASVSVKKTFSENMQQLMDYGVTFSLDDFGTGQSNLNYIVEMPVHIVKFDRSMTVAYFENGKAKYVMDAAMHMIQGMKLKIVSEGIESKEQLETMQELGINYIQGYYFSKPIPAVAFLEFLQKENVSCIKALG
jgi:EAL domain-containing protein (putative c-di-GMP-specific phosphodiesterase class I)